MLFDNLYKIDDKAYGAAIINNARILSRDRLNRCLIDKNVYEWFLTNTNGIENLQRLTADDIKRIPLFRDYEITGMAGTFFGRQEGNNRLNSIDIMKIGEIKIKDNAYDIYNLHLQIKMEITDDDNSQNAGNFTITLGNLNTEGLK